MGRKGSEERADRRTTCCGTCNPDRTRTEKTLSAHCAQGEGFVAESCIAARATRTGPGQKAVSLRSPQAPQRRPNADKAKNPLRLRDERNAFNISGLMLLSILRAGPNPSA
jgi:hypothetical protein